MDVVLRIRFVHIVKSKKLCNKWNNPLINPRGSTVYIQQTDISNWSTITKPQTKEIVTQYSLEVFKGDALPSFDTQQSLRKYLFSIRV